jgi:methyl coenzyme M reductase subunit D
VAVSVVRTGEERAWSLLQVTYNLGGFESVKAGVADYARDGEDAQALAQRVAGLVYSELEAQVQALRSLHVRVETQTGEVSA